MIRPDYKVNEPITTKPKTPHTPEPYSGKKINTTDWEYVNKKMKKAYSDASYKQGRRAMRTGASEATTRKVLSEIAERKRDKRSLSLKKTPDANYFKGKKITRKKKSGVIPRLLKSYASNYKIGIKSIANSISKAPSKAKKFYEKWLKW